MASEVDICNLALAHIGDKATVSAIAPPDGSIQADHCKRFYPIARDALLEMHAWGFATKRRSLSLLSDPPTSWEYRYMYPTDCLKPWAVLPYQATDDQNSVDFIVETASDGTKTILTNEESATLRYTFKITDTTKFSLTFTSVLARLLASYLAGPVLKGKTGREESKNQFNIFTAELILAGGHDANSQKLHPAHTPKWISKR